MAYTTTQLITDAYYASGIVSREFETVSGSEVTSGLQWLNELLAKKVVEPDLIPYEGTTTFVGVVGQESYAIANLIRPDTLTFVKQTVRYPLMWVPRDIYFGEGRVNNITSLPYQWYSETTFAGSTISVYFLPNETYTFTVKGLFRLADVTLAQDLSLTLAVFYITYLKYALASKICSEYAMTVPEGVRNELAQYQALISKQSRIMDVSIKKNSVLQKEQRLGWAWVNLGVGYLP